LQPGGYKEIIKSRLTLSFYEDLGFIEADFFRSMFDTIISLLTSKPQVCPFLAIDCFIPLTF
jgi:hypothetical protein